MAMCTVAEVRAIVDPKSLSDNDITGIINNASNEIAIETGASTDSTDNTLRMACVHMSAALVLRKMKFTGELATQIQLGNSLQSNNVSAEIVCYQELAEKYIKKYRYATSGVAIVYGRAGIKTVNSED